MGFLLLSFFLYSPIRFVGWPVGRSVGWLGMVVVVLLAFKVLLLERKSKNHSSWVGRCFTRGGGVFCCKRWRHGRWQYVVGGCTDGVTDYIGMYG